MKLMIGLVVILVTLYVSFLDWRRAVKAVFFIVVIEGAIRKWVIPQASELIYFYKDFVLLGAYIRYYGLWASERKHAIQNHFVNILIFVVAGWCLFQAFNPSLGSPIVGILGIKAYLFYIPLIWMLPSLFKSETELYLFLRSHLLMVFVTGTVGVIQFFSPRSSWINSYVDDIQADVATFNVGISSAVRVAGTFSYINSYSGYLFVCFGLLIVLLSINQSKVWRWITITELLLVVVNSMMNGSRTVVFSAILFLIGYVSLKGLSQPNTTLRWLGRFLGPALVISMVASFSFGKVLDQFSRRVSSNQDVTDRILISITEPLRFFQYKQLDGYGIGATHPGTSVLRRLLTLPNGEFVPSIYEAEMGRVALELGPIGFVFWYGLRIGIAISLFKLFWQLQRPFLRQLALAAFLIQSIWISGQLVFHHTFSVYYWFFTGFIFLLPRLEQVANWQQQLQWVNSNVQSAYLPDSPNGQSEFS